MKLFRYFVFDQYGRIDTAVDRECRDQAHAITVGETMNANGCVEIWHEGALVIKLTPSGRTLNRQAR